MGLFVTRLAAVSRTPACSRWDRRSFPRAAISSGRFQLYLPPGDYVLRASRDGYLSTYREPVRVVSTTLLERNITLTKQGVASVIPASSADDHSHGDTAWRLASVDAFRVA